jgi:hypothetical protein
VRQVAAAISSPGGLEAINLRVAEQWVSQFGNVAKTGNTLILPANFGDMASLIAAAMTTIKSTTPDGQGPEQPGPKRAS